MVLGAPPRQVLGFVLTKGMRPVVIGVVLGIAASAVLTRFLESQVYGTSTLDPLAFLLPSFCFLIAVFVACQWPAKRATRMDPASVLRAE
jgi:ABC-type antimicrobial peptide transport system permease subunit